ncbi:hypothetical protein O9H85_24775 [Paenibacillus filicis]|uniref:Uncharacterized protein n=1 Tax=Paenibacillus gyeongsangnamensis TaxID=3388067 RepID=A0ABT4QFA7_9BACL|nr:hypothetical protein [Paenibacillus filicis]MCZ8515562.1 hypothetical protein [Paenibacillus filicis]
MEDRTQEAQANYTYDFAVEADEKALACLRELLDAHKGDEQKSFVRTTIQYNSADHDEAMDAYNDGMLKLYSYIYELSVPETRS